MPTVETKSGKVKHFSYTKKGKKAASKAKILTKGKYLTMQ